MRGVRGEINKQGHLSLKVVKRFLTDESLTRFLEAYQRNRKGGGKGSYWRPTDKEWEVYYGLDTCLRDWRKMWGKGNSLASSSTCLTRLGKMYFMDIEKSSNEGIMNSHKKEVEIEMEMPKRLKEEKWSEV